MGLRGVRVVKGALGRVDARPRRSPRAFGALHDRNHAHKEDVMVQEGIARNNAHDKTMRRWETFFLRGEHCGYTLLFTVAAYKERRRYTAFVSFETSWWSGAGFQLGKRERGVKNY